MKGNVILGITGSIAAYKAADIANTLTKAGANVDVVMTAAALQFITPLTLQALSRNRVNVDTFQEWLPQEVRHISLAQKADVFVVAPASADAIAKLALGIGDDMLSTVALALGDIPKIIAPAMNTRMYENPLVQENLRRLAAYGFRIVEPREARLACGDVGKGAMAEVGVIIAAVEAALAEGRTGEGA